MDDRYRNPDNHPRGVWKATPLYAKRAGSEKERAFSYRFKNGVVWTAPRGSSPRFPEHELRRMDENDEIWFGVDGTASPSRKTFLQDLKIAGPPAPTVWLHTEAGNNHEAREEAKAISEDDSFTTPKPEKLLKRILDLATQPGDWVLDSFAGSGTTGAVAHKMGRRWIMVELGEHIHSHIMPRLKKIVDGEDSVGVTTAVGWKGGGGFRYFHIAPSLLEQDKFGNWIISKQYNAAMLAEAMCKLEGFTYDPSETEYWNQGHSTEQDFIYVTTQTLSREQLEKVSEEVGENRSLLVCCSAFRVKDLSPFPNLTVKKIPKMVLNRCEWGHDDYSLEIENLPSPPPEQAREPMAERSNGRKSRAAASLSLFDAALETEGEDR